MDVEADAAAGRRLREWNAIQRTIAACLECCGRWREKVIHPLAVGEIPDPPPVIDILFVGVAPTAEKGRYKGAHFYSSAGDLLRLGLFRLLSGKEFGLRLHDLGLSEGDEAFHKARCFFLHAAKVRPIEDAAPPPDAIEYCALRHLRKEILALKPKAVCFLGTNNASVAAAALFDRDLIGSVETVSMHDWTGLGVVTDQPIRGWERRTLPVLREVWRRAKALPGSNFAGR